MAIPIPLFLSKVRKIISNATMIAEILSSRVIIYTQFAENFRSRFKLLASQSIPSWNQIMSWLRKMDSLRQNRIICGAGPFSE
jgi:hypothetical protein